MAICGACGCSSAKKLDRRRSVSDSICAGEQGAAAESCDWRETGLPPSLLGRALRKQRSRWLQLTAYQRMRRVVFYGMAPAMLAVVPWMMLGSSSDAQIGVCPDGGAPTAESVPALLEDCGPVKKLDLTDESSISLTTV